MFRFHVFATALTVIGFAWASNGSFSMDSTLEVLTTRRSGREGHRHSPDEVKPPIKKADRPETSSDL